MVFGPTFFPPLGPATSQQTPVKAQGWDRCMLADTVVPGHCRILHAACQLKVDPKSKLGADGSNPTFLGMDPRPLQMEITTYTDAHREALAALIFQYLPRRGVKPVPVSIDHPSLRVIDVNSVVITGASALILEPGTTTTKMTLDMLHWLPGPQLVAFSEELFAFANATTTPKVLVRSVRNMRKKPSDTNPPPTKQPGFGGPPPGLGNGQ